MATEKHYVLLLITTTRARLESAQYETNKKQSCFNCSIQKWEKAFQIAFLEMRRKLQDVCEGFLDVYTRKEGRFPMMRVIDSFLVFAAVTQSHP